MLQHVFTALLCHCTLQMHASPQKYTQTEGGQLCSSLARAWCLSTSQPMRCNAQRPALEAQERRPLRCQVGGCCCIARSLDAALGSKASKTAQSKRPRSRKGQPRQALHTTKARPWVGGCHPKHLPAQTVNLPRTHDRRSTCRALPPAPTSQWHPGDSTTAMQRSGLCTGQRWDSGRGRPGTSPGQMPRPRRTCRPPGRARLIAPNPPTFLNARP
jgi:hypothetical protein